MKISDEFKFGVGFTLALMVTIFVVTVGGIFTLLVWAML